MTNTTPPAEPCGSHAPAMRPLDILAPLVRGTTLLEASAGTGKTWTLTSVIARLVAEHDVAITRVLALTFTRAAAAELSGRTRERLVETREALARAGDPRGVRAHREKDKVLHHIVYGTEDNPVDDTTRELRRGRIERALRELDAGHISTIHAFCQTVAQRCAFALGQSFGATLVDDADESLGDIVDDWLLQAQCAATPDEATDLEDKQRLTETSLRELARVTLQWPDATLLPPPERSSLTELRTRAAELGARFADEWRGGLREQVTAALTEAAKRGAFRGKNIGLGQTKKLYKPHVEALAHLDGAIAASTDQGTAAARGLASSPHTRRSLRALLEPGHELPEDPALTRFFELQEEASRLLHDSRRADFLAFLRAEFGRRQRIARTVSFADVLETVRDGVNASGPQGQGDSEAARALRSEFDVVLVDEFQDTDGVQWDIFREAFVRSSDTFVFLVGDPKQAIYAFRGADVRVYETARESAAPERRATLDANYRSDGRLVDALDVLFRDRGPLFEDASPRYVPMHAAPGRHPLTSLRSPAGETTAPPAPLQIRWFDGATNDSASKGMTLGKTAAGRLVAPLVADDIVKLLSRRLELHPGDGRSRPLGAGDIAVLVRKRTQASQIREALRARGVPAVTSETGSVFHGEEADWVVAWLRALAQARHATALAHALSPLGGFDIKSLYESTHGAGGDAAEGERWLSLHEDLAAERELFATRGFLAAFAHLLGRGGAAALQHLAAHRGGERHLTNLRHLEELLHHESGRAGHRLHRDPSAFVRHIAARRHGEGDAESAELRLESDKEAVRITTVHKSKGLEYPVVFVPYAWDGALLGKQRKPLVYHPRRPASSRRGAEVHVEARLEPSEEAQTTARQELLAENMRLLYVALTRARHHLVVYAGPVLSNARTKLEGPREADGGYATSALGVLLHGGRDPDAEPGSRAVVANETITQLLRGGERAPFRATVDALVALAEAGRADGDAQGPVIEWRDEPLASSVAPAPRAGQTQPTRDSEDALFAARFARGLELARPSVFQRASYTSLTRGAHGAMDREDDDAPGEQQPLPRVGPLAALADVPLARFRRGPDAGTFVHELLERLDFPTMRERTDLDSAADEHDLTDRVPPRPLSRLAREEARRHALTEADGDELAGALPAILSAPLGLAAGGIRLADLTTSRRLDELGFDLAVVGGHAFRDDHAPVSGLELAACIAAERLPGEPAAPWPDSYGRALGGGRVNIPSFAGFLTGSLDLVYQVGEGADARYFVADYKTNWVGERDEDGVYRSTFAHYTRPWLVAEMVKHHYFIQAHLYTVALHRLLKQRLGASYSYERHFGGAVYLFLRGLGGEGRPPAGVIPDHDHSTPPGVLVDRPPLRIVEALSSLLDGVTPSWDRRSTVEGA